ncbi:helix-turn-helix domain-containing protein [Nocardia sp. NPDC003482]
MENQDATITGSRLRAAREAAGLSLSGMAERVPYSRAALGHYETGHRTPTAEIVAWYERVCGPFTDAVSSAVALAKNEVDRRSFLRNAVYSAALSASALAPLPESTARLTHLDQSRRVGLAEVRAVRDITAAFHRLDEVRGGGAGRTAVAEFLATDVAALLRARFADATVRFEAFSAAAELAYLTGFKAHDAGADGLAQRYYLAALRLATEGGSDGQAAWALRALSVQSTDIGERRFSVDLAEAAVQRAREDIDEVAMAQFKVTLARCHAETGSATAARDLLREVTALTDNEHTAELPPWMASWTPNGGTVAHQTGKALEALGELREAERYHERATTLWNPETHARVHAMIAGETAMLRLRLGDEAGAARIVNPVLDTLEELESGRTRGVLARISATAPELVVGRRT